MFSSRKYSVKRHIQKAHGHGHYLRYIDYVTDRQAGHYAATTLPSFEKKAEPERDLGRLGTEAFQLGFWEEAGRTAYRKGEKLPQPHRFV
jgi:hypothetical protein